MTRRTEVSAYEEDLAYIHDTGSGAFAEGSAPGLLRLFEKTGLHDGLIVDLGCGSGIWARHLVDAGYEVVGVDISSAMIEIARKRVPEATFHAQSCFEYAFPSCRSITALGEVLNYLFDSNNSPSALRKFCRSVFEALPSGGLFVFDLAVIGVDQDRPKSFWETEDWACLVEFETDETTNQLIRHIVTYRKVGELYRRRSERHRLQLFLASDVTTMLREIGFRVRTVRKYGDYPLHEKRVGFIARKP